MHGRVAGCIRAALLACVVPLATAASAAGQQAVRAQPWIDIRQEMPAQVAHDEAVPVVIVVANTGSALADNVSVTDTLPASYDLAEAMPTPERLHNTLRWSLGSIEPGGQRVLHLRLSAKVGVPSAELRNTVGVTFQTSASNSSVAAILRPAVTLDVTGPDKGVVGEPVSLLISVRNSGTAPAHGVLLQTLLPAGLSHPGGPDLENDIGNLEVGEARQIALAVTPTQAGEIRTRVRVLAPGVESVEREACLGVHEMKLGLSANGPRLLYQNWAGSFELALHNDGKDVVGQLYLMIGLPEGMAFVRASEGATYDAESHSICWNLGDLRPGEGRTLLWNGVARETGDLISRMKLVVGMRVHKEMTWQTKVVQAAPTTSQAPAAADVPPVRAARFQLDPGQTVAPRLLPQQRPAGNERLAPSK
jgi:uncharacterized repeat protein (TIGR01451 family)